MRIKTKFIDIVYNKVQRVLISCIQHYQTITRIYDMYRSRLSSFPFIKTIPPV